MVMFTLIALTLIVLTLIMLTLNVCSLLGMRNVLGCRSGNLGFGSALCKSSNNRKIC
jgi:hypothetical protein